MNDDVSFAKPKQSRHSLSAITAPHGPRVLPATPRIETVNRNTTPLSAPPAAGRSPTRKRLGLQRPRQRFVPPTLSTKSPSLSITAALNGTVAQKKARKVRTLDESKPKSWFFDIYEETEAVQSDRMNDWTISQSATNLLDISDDEGKAGKPQEDRGKENVDPNEIHAPVTRSMAAAQTASDDLKKDIMTDDRIPLGEMSPSKYYPEGLDATSVVLVQDEAPEEHSTVQANVAADDSTPFTFEAMKALRAPSDTEDIGAVIMASEPDWEASAARPTEEQVGVDMNDIPRLEPGEDLDIWESESAKDENEKQSAADDSIFALSEL